MLNLQKFADRLEEMIFETGLNQKEFAKKAGLTPSEISKYLKGNCMPAVKSLIRIVDYFNCPVDYILGLEDQRYACTPKAVPRFSERLRVVLAHFGYSGYKFCKEADKISPARYYEWLNGKYEPSLENIVNIAEFFDCSVDFVIGRCD